jgi:hypothetical protein
MASEARRYSHLQLSAGVMDANYELATWLIAHEKPDPTERAFYDAAERVCGRLSARLSEMITEEGYGALLDRAIHLTRVEFPFLYSTRKRSERDGCLGVLWDADGVAPNARRAALTAVLAGVLGLLTTFIGPDLTVWVVRDVWPTAPYSRGAVPLEDPSR